MVWASPVRQFTVPRYGRADPAPGRPLGRSLPACMWEQSGDGRRTVARPRGRSRLAVASTSPLLSGVGACPHPRLPCPSPSTPGQVGLLRPLCSGPGPCGQGKVPAAGPHWRCPRTHAPTSALLSPGWLLGALPVTSGEAEVLWRWWLQLRVGTEAFAPELDSLGPRSDGVRHWAGGRQLALPCPCFVPAPPFVAR